MNWLDSHCHINDEAFRDDLDDVLNRMIEADVTKAMIISSYLNDYDFALKATAGDVKAGSVEADHKFERNNGLDKSVNANTTSGDVIINFVEDN